MKKETIIHLLPYKAPFLFVEELTFISEDRSEGYYTLKKDEYFYLGHFKDNPVTPGVILIEIMAQIGLVCLGIYLLEKDLYKMERPQIAISNSEVDFLLPVQRKLLSLTSMMIHHPIVSVLLLQNHSLLLSQILHF